MATAYPNRASTNLRGSWMRQFAMTMIGTIILYNLVFKDYKVRARVATNPYGTTLKVVREDVGCIPFSKP